MGIRKTAKKAKILPRLPQIRPNKEAGCQRDVSEMSATCPLELLNGPKPLTEA